MCGASDEPSQRHEGTEQRCEHRDDDSHATGWLEQPDDRDGEHERGVEVDNGGEAPGVVEHGGKVRFEAGREGGVHSDNGEDDEGHGAGELGSADGEWVMHGVGYRAGDEISCGVGVRLTKLVIVIGFDV